MSETEIDLRKEQQATLNRPQPHYSLALRALNGSLDLVAGRKTTFGRIKLLEILAPIPYHAWERCLSGAPQGNAGAGTGQRAPAIAGWSREAAENENWHLQLAEAKMRADVIKDPWYLNPLARAPVLLSYRLASWLLARLNIRAAFLLNAEFEDHADHSYAHFVADNPQWENEPVENVSLEGHPELHTWADVFRRIGLDERNHRNRSYAYAGKPEMIVHYEGMPPVE